MKKLVIAGALALGLWAGSAQAATFSVNFNGGSGTLPLGSTVFQSFDAIPAGTMIGPNAYSSNTTTGLTARPAYGSTGNYGAVLNGGSYTVAFGPTNLFSFVLGSLDAFNSLTLNFADGTSQLLTGGNIINDMTFDAGNRTSAETNGTVSYQVTSGALLTGATFRSSGGNSFEFDNLATGGVGAVPEPAAWAMMIVGFGLVGGALRRRTKTTVRYA